MAQTQVPKTWKKVEKGKNKTVIPSSWKKLYSGTDVEEPSVVKATGQTLLSGVKVVGATIASIPSFVASGYAGMLELLPSMSNPKFETDEQKTTFDQAAEEYKSYFKQGRPVPKEVIDILEQTKPEYEFLKGDPIQAEKQLNNIASIPMELITTPEERESMEYIGNVVNYVPKKSGKGWEEINSLIQNALRSENMPEDVDPIPILEPFLKTLGEAAGVFAVGEFIPTLKKVQKSTYYRSLTVPERNLVVQSLSETMERNPHLTEGELLKRYNNPKWRDEALSRRDTGESGAKPSPMEKRAEAVPKEENKAQQPEVLSPESTYVRDKFSKRFLEDNDIRPVNPPDETGLAPFTPEESFVNNAEGISALKTAQDERAKSAIEYSGSEFIVDQRQRIEPEISSTDVDTSKISPERQFTNDTFDEHVRLAEKHNLDPISELSVGTEGDAVFIRTLDIPKNRRNQGLGTKVLNDIKEFARQQDAELVTSGIKEKDIEFFEKRGFVEDGSRHKWQRIQRSEYELEPKGDWAPMEGMEKQPYFRVTKGPNEGSDVPLSWFEEQGLEYPEGYTNPNAVLRGDKVVVEEGTSSRVDKESRLELIRKRAEARKQVREVESNNLTDEQKQILEDNLWVADESYRQEFNEDPDVQSGLNPEEDFTSFEPYDDSTLYGGLPIQEFARMWTKHIGEPIWDNLIITKLPKLLERIPGGHYVNRALIYDYRGDLLDTPEYMASMEQMRRAQAIGRDYALDLGNRMQKMSQASQLKVGDRMRGIDVKMSPEEASIAAEARDALDSLGRQAVDVGLLSEDTFFKNVGRYLPRLYTAKEYTNLLNKWGLPKPNRIDMSRFKKRKDIPKAIRKELGEIMQPGYPTAKGIVQLTHDIEMARFFNAIAKNPDWAVTKDFMKNSSGEKIPYKVTTYNPLTGEPIENFGYKKEFSRAIPEGWVQLPKDPKLGQLSESYVHPEIAADINFIKEIPTKGEKIWRKTLGMWKFGKVILSPKTHARNLTSNAFLAHLGGMPIYRQPVRLAQAIKEMRKKGEMWQAAKDEGLMDSTFTDAELKTLFENIDVELDGLKGHELPMAFGKIAQVWEVTKKAGNKAAYLYNLEEQWFKMAMYIDNIKSKKMSPVNAAKDAEKWLFNYGKLTRAQERYRSKWYGAPFATFTIKAIPRVVEASVKYPWRFAIPGLIIWQLEEEARKKFGDSVEETAAKEELREEWMQGSYMGIPNFPRVPVSDDYGREYWLNISYLSPWGTVSETGGVFGIPGGVMPLSMPFVQEAWQQLAGSKGFDDPGGYDSFWKEPIVKEEDVAGLPKMESVKVATGKRLRHLYNNLTPTLFLDIEKAIDALNDQPDWRGRIRPNGVVAADVIAGLKMYPTDYAELMQRKVGEMDPESGYVARKIMTEIRTLSIKRNYYIQNNQEKQARTFEKQIAQKLRQLQGLGKKLQESGQQYNTLREDN